MEEKELRKLFLKDIPNAHKSLDDAAAMVNGRAKNRMIEKANKFIMQAIELIEEHTENLPPKYVYVLWQLVEPKSAQKITSLFSGEHSNTLSKKSKVHAMKLNAIKRLIDLMNAKEATGSVLSEGARESIAERIKAREKRLEG